MKFDKEFDASGLSCPLPIVKTKKSLQRHGAGPGAARRRHRSRARSADMPAFAEQTGNALLESSTENSKYVFFLKKKA